MFGCLAVYFADKIVLILRHKMIKRQTRSIQVLGKGVTGWQLLAVDTPDFEEAALRVSAGIKGSHFRRGDREPVPPEMAVGHTSAQTAARSSGWTETYFSQLLGQSMGRLPAP